MLFRTAPLLVALACLCALTPSAARADARLDHLAKQIREAKDPRVRAQAALMLSSLDDPGALAPLCRCLDDDSSLVRSVAARSLGRIGPRGADCLTRHKNDPDAAVRAAIERALETAAGARLYVALEPVVDESGRLKADVLRLANDELRARLSFMGAVFAPPGETREAARDLLRGRGMKGFLLNVKMQSLPGGGLKMTVFCLTYPEKRILGEVFVKAKGGAAPDMIRAMVPKVLDDAARTFEWSS